MTRLLMLLLVVIPFTALPSKALAQDQEGTPPPNGEASESEIAAELPPADLPTMNEQGYTFEIQSTFNGSLDTTPEEAPVFEMTVPDIEEERAQEIASQLGIEGEVEDQGGGVYVAEGNGSLYLAPGLIQYVSPNESPEGTLPTNEEAVAYAREWLRQTNLLPPDLGEGEVRSRLEQPGRVVVVFKPIAPENLLSDLPSIVIALGPAGTVLDASINWATLSRSDVYQLRPADEAWDDVASMRAYLQTQLPEDTYPQGTTITGTAEYTEVDIAYTSSGIPGEDQYLQPVFVYTGRLTPEGSEESYPITAYVPALANSQQPVG